MANLAFGDAAAAKRHDRNACDAFLRASEYFRSAYFFSRRDLSDPRLLDAWRRCRDAFRAAAPLLPRPVLPVRIPFGDIHLEGYVVRAGGREPGPTVLLPCGYDMPVEEFYTLGGHEAAARGLSVVAFSGPGQAEMLYERGIPFRHDFESVVGPVIDFVESRADLDSARIAIVGRSFGGYLAPRAASREPRIGALAADPAQTDMGALLRGRFPPAWLALLERDDPALNDEIWKAFPGVHGQEFWLSRARAHGVSTPLEYLQEMRRWVVDVEAIACPAFVSYGEGDFAQASARAFHDRLAVDNKRFTIYRQADGGGGHCEGMGPSRYYADLFGWLGDV